MDERQVSSSNYYCCLVDILGAYHCLGDILKVLCELKFLVVVSQHVKVKHDEDHNKE